MNMSEFEEKLVQLFNETPLSFEAKRYVVVSFFRNIEDIYMQKRAEMKKQKPIEESIEGSNS